MPSWYVVIRWLHVISATAWVGEVMTVVFVLVPAVLALQGPERMAMLHRVFPRVFKLASVLSGTAVVCGAILLTARYHSSWGALLTTFHGRCYLAGATLGTAVAAFHFFLEPRLEGMICSAAGNGDLELTDAVLTRLRLIPRVGLGVVLTSMMLMMVATRGW